MENATLADGAGCTVRFLLLAALFGAVVYGGTDITIPLDDGRIVIQAAEFSTGSFVPALSFTLKNETSSPWITLKLRFDIGGLCNFEPRQWSLPVSTSVGFSEGQYSQTIISLVGKVKGCKTEIIEATLLLAENLRVRIDGVSRERVDLGKQLQEIKAKREAEAAAMAEEQRIAAEEEAKKAASAAIRQKRMSAERKKKQAYEDARNAQAAANYEAQAAAEKARIRAACATIYKNTSDKKVSDLTVKEEQQVRACQALGLYPPR